MVLHRQISERDLRMCSEVIMDAVELGTIFTIIRDGRDIAQLAPLGRRPRFVSAEEFYSASTAAPAIELDRFWGDLNNTIDPHTADPYHR